MKPTNTVLQIIAVALLMLGVSNATATYQIVQSDGAADISAWLKTLAPFIGAALTSGGGVLSQFWSKIRGGKSIGPVVDVISNLIKGSQLKIEHGSASLLIEISGKQYRCTITEVGTTPAESEAAK